MINGAQDVVLLAVNSDFGRGYTVIFLSVVSRQPCLLVPIKRTVSTLSFCSALVNVWLASTESVDMVLPFNLQI